MNNELMLRIALNAAHIAESRGISADSIYDAIYDAADNYQLEMAIRDTDYDDILAMVRTIIDYRNDPGFFKEYPNE